MNRKFDPNKHPRASNGQFTDGNSPADQQSDNKKVQPKIPQEMLRVRMKAMGECEDDARHFLNRDWKIECVLNEIPTYTKTEATLLVDSIFQYTRNGHEFKEMRRGNPKYQGLIPCIEEYLKAAEAYKGVITRGISVKLINKNCDWVKSYLTPGAIISHNMFTSWSYDELVSSLYAENESEIEIILKNDEGLGVQICHLSSRERECEVLVSSQYDMKVINVTETLHNSKKRYNVNVMFIKKEN